MFPSFFTATDYRAANYSLTNTNPYIIIYKIEKYRTFCPFFQTIETAAGWRIPVTLNIRPIARPGLYVKSTFIRKLRGAFRVVPRSVPFVLPHTSSGRDPPIRLCFSSWRAKRWAISCEHICATSLFICSYVTRFVRVVKRNFLKLNPLCRFRRRWTIWRYFLVFLMDYELFLFFYFNLRIIFSSCRSGQFLR